MTLDSAAFISRSNSDLLTIRMIANNVNMSAGARMIAIVECIEQWDKSTNDCTARYTAIKEFKRRKENKTLHGSI